MIYAWHIAAAILFYENTKQINTLTDSVYDHPSSRLGKNGQTPEKTLGAALRKKPEIFQSLGDGDYGLANADEVLKHPEILELCIEFSPKYIELQNKLMKSILFNKQNNMDRFHLKIVQKALNRLISAV